MKIVGTGTITGVLGESERRRIEDLQKENRKFVTIPRRFVSTVAIKFSNSNLNSTDYLIDIVVSMFFLATYR